MEKTLYCIRHGYALHNKLFFEKTLFFEMPEERSIDIDTKLDFEIVEYLMNKNSSNYNYD